MRGAGAARGSRCAAGSIDRAGSCSRPDDAARDLAHAPEPARGTGRRGPNAGEGADCNLAALSVDAVAGSGRVPAGGQ